ncbi:MAG: zf-HC2 domain-containing protein [Deltaproteobacteria bacterium]|nr:zf-HC2 domain-containing protein [Deltaproteobacteria bacterium]
MNMLCPDEERLVDYLEGRLSKEDSSQIEEHLSNCDTCLEGLVVTNGLVRGMVSWQFDPVPTRVTDRAVRLVASQRALSYDSLMEKLRRSIQGLSSGISELLRLKPWARWQLAPIRGSKMVASEDFVCLRVPFKETETEIEIEKTRASKAHIRVKVQEHNKKRRAAVRVTLKSAEREVASYLLDGTHVLFEDIPFGHYSITLAENGVELGTYLFEIKETRHGRK